MSENVNVKLMELLSFTPVQTLERFSFFSGLPEGVVRGMTERGQLPTRKIGKRRLVNLVKLAQECSE
ncbi:hypothetical protein ACFQ0F_08395 [Paraperlucidibaca wandonensis]|uniref:DNA-binding protein n=1 Tax=Paraperlucidibaca wandonensis TaxID=1268273 RepID=A0ABW3HHX6_9GAMM